MKNLHLGLLGLLGLLFIVTSCSGMFGLSTEDTSQSPVYSDTIQYIMQYDSAYSATYTVNLYAWEQTADGSTGLDTSRVQPEIIDTNYIPFINPNNWGGTGMFNVFRAFVPVDTIHKAYPNPEDTVYVTPIYDNGIPVYSYDTISVPLGPDDVDSFLESHPPRITNGEELVAALDTINEGYRTIEYLMVQHISKDGSSFNIIDTPDFLDRRANNCSPLTEELIYHKPGPLIATPSVLCTVKFVNIKTNTVVAEPTVENAGGSMNRWILEPMQGHAGKTYEWGVVVTNRVGAGDTLWFETYVVPFDSTIWDE